jgi:hypothetical protein
VVAGIGAGIVGAGAAFYAVGLGPYNEGEKACPTHKACTSDATNIGQQGFTLIRVGVGGFIVGGAALVGGLVWYFAQPSKPARVQSHGEPRSTAASGVYVTPVVTPNFAGGSAGFSF